MNNYSSRYRPTEPVPSTSSHKLVSARLRACVNCKKLSRKTIGGNTIRSSSACGFYEISLCKNYFVENHSQ